MSFKFTQSKRYKVVMNYVYGWGASAVIIGALFKIMHFPGATYVLSAGMIVEAIIFFLSAFEPQLDHYKWTNLFPELNPDFNGEMKAKNFGGGQSLDIIDEDTKQTIKEGLDKIVRSVENVKDISEIASVSSSYKESMKLATSAITSVAEGSSEISSKINDLSIAVNSSSDGFKKISDSVSNYAKFVEAFETSFKTNSESFTNNIGALNSVYELQIRNTNEYLNSFTQAHEGIKNISSNISGTLESTKLYKEQAELLGKNISSLNDVYGNMLSVFNNSKSK